jgi:hypothetical protein
LSSLLQIEEGTSQQKSTVFILLSEAIEEGSRSAHASQVTIKVNHTRIRIRHKTHVFDGLN